MNDGDRGLHEGKTSEPEEEVFSSEGARIGLEDKKKARENALQGRIHSARHDVGIKSFTSKPVVQKTEVEVITQYTNRKEKLRELAFDELEKKLTDRVTCCPKCFGTGENNGKDCPTCAGKGTISIEADMRAIELVLKPEYPKTSVSINANIDGMKPNEIISMLQNMHKRKNA